MPKELRIKAEKASEEMGFSSLQEAVRIFLNKLSSREVDVTFREQFPAEYIELSPAAEKRYKKIKEDIEAGRNVTKTKNIDELMKLLHK